jgi:hypothetical protein
VEAAFLNGTLCARFAHVGGIPWDGLSTHLWFSWVRESHFHFRKQTFRHSSLALLIRPGSVKWLKYDEHRGIAPGFFFCLFSDPALFYLGIQFAPKAFP